MESKVYGFTTLACTLIGMTCVCVCVSAVCSVWTAVNGATSQHRGSPHGTISAGLPNVNLPILFQGETNILGFVEQKFLETALSQW